MGSDVPKVTVLMPVYNGEKYLREAIDSILNQTFGNFEFIIISDDTNDATHAILDNYEKTDPRIKIYYQERQGLIASLNRGCRLAKGKYIARMDADDISLPDRLDKQLRYLEIHPEIGILGTWIDVIDKDGKHLEHPHVWPLPTSPRLMRWHLTFNNSLAHPTVMMRRDIIEQVGFYNPGALHAEDYDLWVRTSYLTQLAIIPEILLHYRFSGDNVSFRHILESEKTCIRIVNSIIATHLGSKATTDTVKCFLRISSCSSLGEIYQACMLIQQLFIAYLKANNLNPNEEREVAMVASKRLMGLALSASRISLPQGIFIFVRAIRLSPELLFSRTVILEGIKKFLRVLNLLIKLV